MWSTQHSSTPSRVSAKNVDLRIATGNEQMVQPATYSLQTEMWMTQHQQRSRTPSIACSVPTLSPHSLTAQDDDVLSQDSESTAFSLAPAVEQKEQFDVEILAPDRYESQVDATEMVSEFSDVSKTLQTEGQQSFNKEPKTPRVEGDLIAFEPTHTEKLLPNVENNHIIETLPPTTAIVDDVDIRTPTVHLDTIGPLREQLLAVISKVSILETNCPTVMAADYAELQQRLAKLEADKADLSARHEALFAIRDEDVVNLVNVRALLAKERREHDALRKLRDEDLENVIQLRNKLAQATWTSGSANNSQLASPQNDKGPEKHRHQSSSTPQSHDLWQAAKTAALEQRVLELESANADLRGKIELSKAEVVADEELPSTEQHGIDPAARRDTDAVILASAAAAEDQPRHDIDLLFELALRNHQRHNTAIKELKAKNLHLRGKLEDKDA